MALIVTDESILSNEFLFYFLYYKKLFKIADTSQIPQINNVHINPYPIHLPPISDQKNLIKKLNEVLLLKDRNNSKITSSKSLQKSLINQIF
jgi:type I restriction enzyme S subunit